MKLVKIITANHSPARYVIKFMFLLLAFVAGIIAGIKWDPRFAIIALLAICISQHLAEMRLNRALNLRLAQPLLQNEDLYLGDGLDDYIARLGNISRRTVGYGLRFFERASERLPQPATPQIQERSSHS